MLTIEQELRKQNANQKETILDLQDQVAKLDYLVTNQRKTLNSQADAIEGTWKLESEYKATIEHLQKRCLSMAKQVIEKSEENMRLWVRLASSPSGMARLRAAQKPSPYGQKQDDLPDQE
jgi:chromosome segregation ATPase